MNQSFDVPGRTAARGHTAETGLSSAGGVHALIEDRSFIGGRWAVLRPDQTFATIHDPATGECFARVADCDESQIAESLDHAQAAFAPWRALMARERGAVLTRWAELMRRNHEALACLMVMEQGKPLSEARGEMDYAISFVDWYAAEAERAYGETMPTHKPGAQVLTRQQPLGVVVAITPWNFPSAMITRKASAALAAGCPVIVKPAPETPLSALALARLAEQAGFPPGVFQVVTGDAEACTRQLLADNRVRAVSFTGSTRVGRLILEQAAAGVKRVSVELGGNAPFIVFDDCDLSFAVRAALAAKFATSGQDCLAANRIYVARALYEPFVDAMARSVAELRVGHGLDPRTEIGPMTRLTVADNCRAQIRDAVARGARIVAGGLESRLPPQFVMPTLLADVSDDMLIAREETFGPVAAVLPFDEEDKVVARANATEMGLAAYVYTNDLRRSLRLSDALEYGMVAINTASFTGPPVPFGGWKQSGLGREGARAGMSEFLETKYLCFGDLAA